MASRSSGRHIPEPVRRRVLVEAGHRCAIPTCRHIDVDIHHITPWAEGQAHDYDNLIALCPNCHRRADAGNIDRKSLHIYKARLRTAHDKFSNLEMDLLFQLAKLPSGVGIEFPSFNLMLLNRMLDAGYIEVGHPKSSARIMGMQISPVLIRMTPEGLKYLEDLGIDEPA